MQRFDGDRKTEGENLTAPINRPTFPERILEEFPELTVSQYLRYSLTGQLPEEIEDGLRDGAKKFIEAGLALEKLPRAEELLPENYTRATTSEELFQKVDEIVAEGKRIVFGENISVGAVERLADHMRSVHSDSFYHGADLSIHTGLRSVETAANNRLQSGEESPESKAALVLLSFASRRFYDREPINELLRKEVKSGELETMKHMVEMKVLFSPTLNFLVYNESDIQPLAGRILTEVLPAVQNQSKEQFDRIFEGGMMLGEYGELIANLARATRMQNGRQQSPEVNSAIERQANFIVDQTVDYLKNGRFLCHIHAVQVLSAIQEITVKDGRAAIEPEKLKELLDLVVDKKVKSYSKTYPNVASIKGMVRTLSSHAGVKIDQPSLVKDGILERIGSLFG